MGILKFINNIKIPSILLTLIFSCAMGQKVIETKCVTMLANVNTNYNGTLNYNTPIVYQFEIYKHNFKDLTNTHLRIEVSTDEKTTLECPVIFVIRQKKHITDIEVPYSIEEESSSSRQQAFSHTHAGRTLCILAKTAEARNISVRVSTCSTRNVSYKLAMTLKKDFILPLERKFTVEVTPSNPKFYGFQFTRPDTSIVKLRVSSPDSHCMTLSIQKFRCPVFDKENNVRYEGVYQTMSTTGAITLEKRGKFENGFIVAFVAHHNDSRCSATSDYFSSRALKAEKVKRVTLYITDESAVSALVYNLCLFLPVLFTFIILIAVTLLYKNRHNWIREETKEKFSSDNASGLVNSTKRGNGAVTPPHDLQTIEEFIMADLGESTDDESVRASDNLRQDSDEAPVRMNKRVNSSHSTEERRICRASVFIADFICKDQESAAKSSRRFYWNIVIIAIFYSIPVYQLITHYLRVLYKTGEYDICYYNYLCAQKLGFMLDFNHFWSNISYVIFGIAYILLVKRRARNFMFSKHPKTEEENEGCLSKCNTYCFFTFPKVYGKWDCGIPQNWGIFYALGLALICEGLMSAGYHLCPNQSSFQFDTCFMYVIAVLLMMKIFEFRHPIHFGASQAFVILAALVIISVIGLMFEFENSTSKLIYRWIFISFQYVMMIFMSIYYYSVGYIKKDDGMCLEGTMSIFTKVEQLRKQGLHVDRLILPGLIFAVSIAVLVFSEIQDMDFASYLLYLLVAGVLTSILYYVVIMKPLHGEFKNWTWVQPSIYFLAAGIIGGFAMNYFVQSPAAWEKSASASREGNEECMKSWFPFHPFYDSHDAWHFTSAISLFLMFMGLLIVDDDLLTTPQNKIPVF